MKSLGETITIESHHHDAPTSSRVARIRSFVWHLLQMILAMQLGMALYMLFTDQLAPASYRTIPIS